MTDFGISQIESDRALRAATISTPNVKLGETYRGAHTPMYASPQQKRGQKADVRDDVYALGILGYQLLLGDVAAERPAGKWRKRLADSQVAESVLELLESCWDDDANERPKDALAMAEALGAQATESIFATPAALSTPVVTTAPILTADPAKQYAEWQRQVEETKLQAEQARKALDFARATALWESLPEKHRFNSAYEECRRQRDAMVDHWGKVQSGWREMTEEELGDHLEAVLALQPDHPQAKPWLDSLIQPKHGKTFTNSLGMKFAWIPPGKFLMGSPPHENGRSDDENQVQVQVSKGFYLGVYTVTQEEYERVTGNNPSWFSRQGGGKGRIWKWWGFNYEDTRRFPVECVSWYDAVAFCNLLSEKEGLPTYYRIDGDNVTIPNRHGAGYRLPTEAEWEYGCRAGTTTPYHFGKKLSNNQANFESHLGRTCPVGSYPANSWGLYDMHGNVWEWCQDFYKDKLAGGVDPCVQERVSNRVLRGGCWFSYGWVCRSAFRFGIVPANRDFISGFRAVAVPAK